jgi:Ser/Thr protein kinase RdoA (MazF antagonist)
MPTYPATETANGDILVTLGDTTKRIVARRERPGQLCTVIALDGTFITAGDLAGRMHLTCLKYRFSDGYEKWGEYLGRIVELLEPKEDTE